MALRRPAAHLRRPSAMRLSGDQSYWDSLMSEGEPDHTRRPPRTNRPQSAIEGGQLDGWLEQLYRMQGNKISGLSSRTSSTTTLDREPSGFNSRQPMTSSVKRGSYSCGTPSQCASSLGSQESLQTGLSSSSHRRGSWERARIEEAPTKEQTQLSDLSPVKIGWLPIQRRVMKVSDATGQNKPSDLPSNQVKLKQPIAPTLQRGCPTNSIYQGSEAERSHSRQSTAGRSTWQTPDQGSTKNPQVPEKQCAANHEVNKPVGWQALRRGWRFNQQPSVPAASPSNSDQQQVLQHTPEPNKQQMSQDSWASISRARSGQPLKATGPVGAFNSGSSVTTIVPQSKGSFSSITISSRRVSRSASLPGSDDCHYTNSDSNAGKFTMRRNATIVKVTEQRTIEERVPPLNSLDGIVQRRKATIIKVTEHRESYRPATTGTGTRHPVYRHSYTGGSQDNMWGSSEHRTVPYHRADSAESSDAPNNSGLVKNGDRLHTSTIRVFVNPTPAIAAPAREVTPKRSPRPVSCYANVFEPKTETIEHPPVWKWSTENLNGTNSSPGRSFIRPGSVGPVVTKPTINHKSDKPILPQTNEVLKRSSSNLTLFKESDPQTPQSPEEVLALNAAAVIASIKQLSSQRKKTNGSSERDSNAPSRGNIVTHEGKCVKIQQRPIQNQRSPHAVFLPLYPERSGEGVSLQEALRRSRPQFITRSQTRVQKVARRARERRERAKTMNPQRKRDGPARTTALQAKVFKPIEASIKPVHFTSTWTHDDVKSEEKKKNEPLLTSRQRIESFKKRLWDQLLQRSNK